MEENPRPDEMHKLALLFPVKSELPQLIWIETRAHRVENVAGMVYEGVDCSKGLVTHVGMSSRSSFSSALLRLEIYKNGSQSSVEANQCLFYITRGYSSREVSIATGAPHDWNGPIIVVGFAERNVIKQVKKYRDVTLDDLRYAIDSHFQKMIVFEDNKPNFFVIRGESKWVKAVKVSCEGDVRFLRKAKFRQLEIRKDHSVFKTFDGISVISQHMGWPLLAK